MKIPKIIHQTWKNNDIPDIFQTLANTWKDHHPDWEYRLWTDEDNAQFIADNYPGFKQTYDTYTANIQRVDAVRYLILQTYGGIFVDMDFVCSRNMDDLLKDTTCVFGKEPEEHCELHGKDFIISNAFMATIPQHDFFSLLRSELQQSEINMDHVNNNILESTGPFMVSRVYNECSNKQEVTILDSQYLFPLTKDEISQLLHTEEYSEAIQEKLKNAYAVHYYIGTWWDQNAGTFINKIKSNFQIAQ